MLQTRNLKVEFKGDYKIEGGHTVVRKRHFENCAGKYDHTFPKTITNTIGEVFEYERKIFECQQWKFVYRNGYSNFITIW